MLRQTIALVAALLVGAVVFVWAESYSSSFHNCVDRSGDKASSENSQSQSKSPTVFIRSYVRCTERFADSHNALITALGTILLAAITFGLILAGVDQQRTTRAQLRAYVSVMVGSGFNQGGKYKLRFEFRPVILNTGQTPAFDLETRSHIDLLPHPIPRDFDFTLPAHPVKSVMTMGPQQNRFTQVIANRKFSLMEIREIKKANKQRLCIYGTIKYRDVFREWHCTNYCYAITFFERRRPIWNTTELHNDSD